jgi:Raf kinase inhibitor-like YbhB/YbcL family protein
MATGKHNVSPFLVAAACFWLISGSGCKSGTRESDVGGSAMKIDVSSADFKEGETIPVPYTADGKNISPALRWTAAPDATKSFALMCDDPDAPRKTWVHWVIFNIPASSQELPEAVPTKETLADGARQGKNDFGKIGYGGPSPPPGKPHRYYFKLYALDIALDLPAGSTKDKLLGVMKGHVLAEGQLMGRYGR